MKVPSLIIVLLFLINIPVLPAQSVSEAEFQAVESQVIEWRRHFHQYPELSNREFETGKYIAARLKEMGIEVETGIAHTGVVGLIKGGKPGPTVALRADIDGLPVIERVDLPFASKVKTNYLGKEVGAMHACGHDTHIAMLLGAAQLLKNKQEELSGNIVLIFQPAEEGAPIGEEGGAKLIVKEGILKKYEVDVIFGQHIGANTKTGTIDYRFGGIMAAADQFEIKVTGQQAHGSRPWSGVDPITVSAQIILGLQTIISRQTELTKEAAVITVGKIDGGVRNNIIPETCTMIGTIRTLDKDMQKMIHEKIRNTAEHIAAASGAKAEVTIHINVPVTFNDRELTQKMLPTLFETAGEDNVRVVPAKTGAEDFSYYANEVPAFFYFLGGRPADIPVGAPSTSHHTPDFYIEESGLLLGVKTMTNLTLDYLRLHRE
jgi:amidohydrolase